MNSCHCLHCFEDILGAGRLLFKLIHIKLKMTNTHTTQLDLNLLRVFYWIYVERSVGAAGRQLGITQSAVSHSLRKLRETFGDELFVRAGSSMLPTTKAMGIFDPIDEMLRRLEGEVLPSTRFDPAAAQRSFSLAMIDMAEIVFLPPLMRYLKVHAPRCTLQSHRVGNEAMVNALETGTAELALGTVSDIPAYLYRQNLFQHGYQVLAWVQHPRLAKKKTLSWHDYQSEQHVAVLTGTDHYLETMTLLPKGIRRRISTTVGGYLSVPWLLESSDLIATVPTKLADIVATPGSPLKQFPLPEPAVPYTLHSLWHPRWQNDPAHRWLRGVIFQIMSRYPAVD
ncbi:LysR family transcriptional regulator [Azoarcus sp. TTM-91]|nr:LysR family transcriptional regulator [Azoarcus sp. TTM-91]